MVKKTLEIDKITAGMQLAEPVMNPAGVTLMPAGIRLTPMFILRLKKWNITELDVMVDERKAPAGTPAPAKPAGGGTTQLSAREQAQAMEIATEVSAWFVNVQDKPLMMDLRAVVINRLVAQGGGGGLLKRLRATAMQGGAGRGEGKGGGEGLD